MHKLRLNAIGPLIANSPTDLLIDTLSQTSSIYGVLNPIKQFSQTPKISDKHENTNILHFNMQNSANVIKTFLIKYKYNIYKIF